jgi:hypothetical protein
VLVGLVVYLAVVLGLRQGYRLHGVLLPVGILAGVALLVALRAATRSVDLYPNRMVVHGFWPRTISRGQVHGFVLQTQSGLRGGACTVVAQDGTGLGIPICTIPGYRSPEVHAFVKALESWAGVDPIQMRRQAVDEQVSRLSEITKRLETWHPDE